MSAKLFRDPVVGLIAAIDCDLDLVAAVRRVREELPRPYSSGLERLLRVATETALSIEPDRERLAAARAEYLTALGLYSLSVRGVDRAREAA